MNNKQTKNSGKRRTLLPLLLLLFLVGLLFLAHPLVEQQISAAALDRFSPQDFIVRVNQKWTGAENGTWAEPFITFMDGWDFVQDQVGSADFPAVLFINGGHYAAAGSYDQPAIWAIHDDGRGLKGPVVLEPFPELRGIANPQDCPWGSPDCNRCVADVEGAFGNLRDHGEILAFHMGDHPAPEWGLGTAYHKHWQGLQRLAVAPDGQDAGRYMVLTRDDINVDGAGYSGFQIVYMGSRSDQGERLRSNRLIPRKPFRDSPPPAEDIVVKTQLIDGEHEHPGGIQVLGQFLIVGVDEEVHLYDLSDPRRPEHLGPPETGALDGIGPIFTRPGKTGSSTSLAKLSSGRYLLVISSSDARPLDFYISDQANALLNDPADITFSNFDRLTSDQISVIFGDKAQGGYQSINLITECGSGQLYLIGSHNNGGCIGSACDPWEEDRAVLYKVDVINQRINLEKIPYGDGDGRHFYCTQGFDSGNGFCNFDAAAGIYVDPSGQLILYAAEHDNDGPDETVEFMEFRQVPRQSQDPQGSCSTLEEAWVELYRNDFNDSAGLGESLVIDYRDRDLEDYRNYGFFDPYGGETMSGTGWWDYGGGRISSLRWCLPSGGPDYLLWEKEYFSGWHLTLEGSGHVEAIPNLHNFNNQNRGDAISSSCWTDESGCTP